MNGWNRLFVVVAVFWTVAVPFLVVRSVNSPVEQTFARCSDLAYHRYGASDSWIRLDRDKYEAESAKCKSAFMSGYVVIQTVLSAMVGIGDRTLTLLAWGLILIPLGLLWVIGWGLGRTVRWVAIGFRANRVENKMGR